MGGWSFESGYFFVWDADTQVGVVFSAASGADVLVCLVKSVRLLNWLLCLVVWCLRRLVGDSGGHSGLCDWSGFFRSA